MSITLSNLTQNLIEEKGKMINALKSYGGGKTIIFKNDEKYFKNPSTRAEFIFDVIKTSNFEEIKKKYQFQDEVMKKFKSIYYSNKIQGYEKIDISTSSFYGTLYKVFGLAKKYNDQVLFAVIKSTTSSSLIPKYQDYEVEYCNQILFIKSCKKGTAKRLRGNTKEELKIIIEGLTLHADMTIQKKLLSLGNDCQIFISDFQNLYSLNGQRVLSITPDGRVGVGQISSYITYRGDNRKVMWRYFGNSLGKDFEYLNHQPFSLQVKDNGNLVIADKNNMITWSANTQNKGIGPFDLIVTGDGDLVLIDSKNKPLFSLRGRYNFTQFVLIEDYRLYSQNGNYFTVIQPNGELCVYKNNKNDGSVEKISGFRPEILVKKKSFGPYSVNIDLKGVLSIYDYFLEQDIFKTPLNEKAVSPFNLVVTNEGKLNLVDAKNTILWTQ